jgi:tripartite-type tricarboxylate transporter receptor subunit TctC
MKRRDWMQGTAALAAAGSMGAGSLAALWPALARAQGGDYPKPDGTLRYVVPFPPGGLTDAMARQVAQQLGERWKINVLVDNRPGGNGQIGADLVAKAAGDGYTMLAITLTHAANVTLFPKSPFNFQKDLRPVALLAGSPMLIVVPAASPMRDMQGLVAAARERQLNAGSSGSGTPPHLTLALFNNLTKSSIQHVPYKGGAPCMTDLIGGQLDVVFSNIPESIPHVKAGKLRALAIASKARYALLPEVPTTAEAGMPELQVENWTAIMVPASTSDAPVQKLGAEVVKILGQPGLDERMRQQGFVVDARGPERFAPFLADEIARWAQVIKAAAIQPS